MKFQVVPSGMQDETRFQYLVSYVVNGHVAIDAGAVGFGLTLAEQRKITDIFLSHCHLDHTASLPIFLDNVYKQGPECVTIHGGSHALSTIHTDMLNDRIWPDFVALSTPASPFLTRREFSPLEVLTAGELRITPVELKHVVPTVGFIISDAQASIAVISDTLHGSGVLSRVARAPNLKAVFLECSFPSSMNWLAEKAQHLTPTTFAEEIKLLPPDLPVYAIHLKPAWYEPVATELAALGLPNVKIGEIGVTYEF